jgi:hypothetical protein
MDFVSAAQIKQFLPNNDAIFPDLPSRLKSKILTLTFSVEFGWFVPLVTIPIILILTRIN